MFWNLNLYKFIQRLLVNNGNYLPVFDVQVTVYHYKFL